MTYLLIIAVFLLNYVIWRYFLVEQFKYVLKCNYVLEIVLALVLFLIIPYILIVVTTNFLQLDTKLLSNIMVVFCLCFIAIISYKDLKNYVEKG